MSTERWHGTEKRLWIGCGLLEIERAEWRQEARRFGNLKPQISGPAPLWWAERDHADDTVRSVDVAQGSAD